MSLGERIRNGRKKLKLTQKAMAEKLGMGESNFGHIENNRVTPSSTDLDTIAEILGMSTDYLLGRTTDPVKSLEPKLTDEQQLELTKILEESERQLKHHFNHEDIMKIKVTIMNTYFDMQELNQKAKKETGEK